MARLTKLQQLLVKHIKQQGGDHVYISRAWAPPAGSGLSGYTWEGVNLSLRSLVARGVLRVVKESFYYLAEEKQMVDSPLEYRAEHRGADKHGVMCEQWFPVYHQPSLTLAGAMDACQQMFDSGLLYHPSLSEFRICQEAGTPTHEAKPPHGQALQWLPANP